MSERTSVRSSRASNLPAFSRQLFSQIVDRKDGQIVKQYPRKTEQLLLVDPDCYEGQATLRLTTPRPLGKMARKLEEIAAMPVQQRSIDIYTQVAEVAR